MTTITVFYMFGKTKTFKSDTSDIRKAIDNEGIDTSLIAFACRGKGKYSEYAKFEFSTSWKQSVNLNRTPHIEVYNTVYNHLSEARGRFIAHEMMKHLF